MLETDGLISLQTLDAIKRQVGPDDGEISLGFVGLHPPNYAVNTIYP